jgi:hypothetical protein
MKFEVDKDMPLIPTSDEVRSVLQLVEKATIEEVTLFQEELYEKGFADGRKAAMDELVRCKDCKHGELDDSERDNYYHCRHHGCDWNDGEHFCGYGERKDDAENV